MSRTTCRCCRSAISCPTWQASREDILKRARLLWLNYPSNPTAATASLEFFAEVMAFAREHDLLVCHDAAYSQVSFDGFQPPSLHAGAGGEGGGGRIQHAVEISQHGGLAGGGGRGQPRGAALAVQPQDQRDSGHFLPVLEAATAAMTGDQGWLEERNAVYQERRDLVMQACKQLGWQAATPKASLYVWFHVPRDGPPKALPMRRWNAPTSA